MANESDDGQETTTQLAPPQPMDPISTRPELNVPHMVLQIRGIQTFLAAERAKKEEDHSS